GKCAAECELEARRRGRAIRERVPVGLQRDIVVDHRAEPADRVDGPGREFRVVAVKGDVDLEWCFGSATEWIGKVRGGRELLGGGSEVVRPALNDGGRLDAAKAILPKKTSVVGCAAKSKAVTISKLPPPPRIAQNSSGFSSALACTTSPS